MSFVDMIELIEGLCLHPRRRYLYRFDYQFFPMGMTMEGDIAIAIIILIIIIIILLVGNNTALIGVVVVVVGIIVVSMMVEIGH